MPRFLRSRGAVEFGTSAGIAVVAFALAMGLVALSGAPVGAAMAAMWDGAFGSPRQIGATAVEVTVLTVLAVAFCVAFAGERTNVGLEGQAIVGGIGAAAFALAVDLPPVVEVAAATLAGVVCGTTWAAIAAVLWARRGVSEIISTLMLNLVALQILAWIVRGPLRDGSQTYPQSPPLDGARWGGLVPGTPVTWAVTIMPLAVIGVWFVMRHTVFGYHLRLAGANDDFALAMGVSPKRVGVSALLFSGALGGLAGTMLVLGGQSAVMTDNFVAGRGFEAIAVAMLARNRPVACIPAALLFAVLQKGGGLMEARVGVSSAVVSFTQGLVIVLVAAGGWLVLRYERGRRQTDRRTTPAPVAVGS